MLLTAAAAISLLRLFTDGTFLDRNGHAVTVAGYEARPGYDLEYTTQLSVDLYELFLDGLYKRF